MRNLITQIFNYDLFTFNAVRKPKNFQLKLGAQKNFLGKMKLGILMNLLSITKSAQGRFRW